MQNRFKRLIKLIAESDASTIQAEAARVKELIQAEIKDHHEALARLQKEDEWVDTTLTIALPSTPVTSNSKHPTYKPAGEVGADGFTKKDRGKHIREAALSLVAQGQTEISKDDVLIELARRGVQFKIQRPYAAVGSTLSQMKQQFERTEVGNYRYIGTEIQSDVLPLESAEAH
jgi:DNA-binding NarL/FixJ family response regulator